MLTNPTQHQHFVHFSTLVPARRNAIEKWCKIQDKLALYLTTKNGYEITRENVFNALFIRLGDKFQLEWQGDLWDIEITFKEALNFIMDFDFKMFSQNVVLDSSIFPRTY